MIFEFKFPDVGEGVHEGKILQLKFKPGDKVEAGEILAVVETDKVVAEIPTSKSGTLKRYGAEEGQIIEVGKTLAFIELEGSTGDTVKDEGQEKKTIPISEDDNAGVVGQLESAGNFVLPASGEGFSDHGAEKNLLTGKGPKVLATPLARKMAQDRGIDIAAIKGTGPAGRVTKEDILKAQAELKEAKVSLKTETTHVEVTKVSAPLPEKKAPQYVANKLSDETIELSTMRKTIAKNMEASHAVPTATLHEMAVIDELKAMRELINKGRTERLSYLPIFVKIIAVALKQYPQFNALYDASKGEVRRSSEVNIGIAVETEKGLMVPVIKNVDKKNIYEINDAIKALVAKAKTGNIGLDDLRGGTISLTNYGSFGGIHGNPLLLPPQVAIIGLGRIHDAPVVKNGQVVPATVLPLSLVFDHRVIDGAPAGSFATYLRELLSEPFRLLAEMN